MEYHYAESIVFLGGEWLTTGPYAGDRIAGGCAGKDNDTNGLVGGNRVRYFGGGLTRYPEFAETAVDSLFGRVRY